MFNLISASMYGIGLAMDAFATSVSNGICLKKSKLWQAIVSALFFGGFQMLMPLIGWLLASVFSDAIRSFDHWIAFILLGIIGVNMIRETIKDDEDSCFSRFSIKLLLFMAVATSIDALIVGVTIALSGMISFLPVLLTCTVIGIITFIFSFAGFYIGKFFGGVCKKYAGIVGGSILIFIGIKILVEHLTAI